MTLTRGLLELLLRLALGDGCPRVESGGCASCGVRLVLSGRIGLGAVLLLWRVLTGVGLGLPETAAG